MLSSIIKPVKTLIQRIVGWHWELQNIIWWYWASLMEKNMVNCQKVRNVRWVTSLHSWKRLNTCHIIWKKIQYHESCPYTPSDLQNITDAQACLVSLWDVWKAGKTQDKIDMQPPEWPYPLAIISGVIFTSFHALHFANLLLCRFSALNICAQLSSIDLQASSDDTIAVDD